MSPAADAKGGKVEEIESSSRDDSIDLALDRSVFEGLDKVADTLLYIVK